MKEQLSAKKLTVMFLAFCALIILWVAVEMDTGGQVVPIKSATAPDTETVGTRINQTRMFKLPDTFEKGERYKVTVQYVIVEKKSNGKTLFTKDFRQSASDDNLAQFGCKPIKVESSFYARNKTVIVRLSLDTLPSDIHHANGDFFDPKTHQLVPVITTEQT